MVNVNKAELVDRLSERLEISKKEVAEIVETVIDEITKAVAQGEKVALTGFGVFEKAERAARTGRNPLTGAVVKIRATSVPRFRAGTEFKAMVSGKRRAAKKAAPAAKKAAPAKKAPAKKAPAKKTTARGR